MKYQIRIISPFIVSLLVFSQVALATPAFDYVSTVIQTLGFIKESEQTLQNSPTSSRTLTKANQLVIENVEQASAQISEGRALLGQYAASLSEPVSNVSIGGAFITLDRAYELLAEDFNQLSNLMKSHLNEANENNWAGFDAALEEFREAPKAHHALLVTSAKLTANSMLEAKVAAEGEASNLALNKVGAKLQVRRAITEAERKDLIKQFKKKFGKKKFKAGKEYDSFELSLIILWEALNRPWELS